MCVDRFFHFSWKIPRRGIAGSWGTWMVSILRNYHSVFQSGHSILQSHQPWIRVPVLACLFFFCLLCMALASKAHSCPHMVPRLAPSSCKHVAFQPSNPNRYFIFFLNLHFKVLGWFQFICFGQTFSLEPIRLPDKTQNFWFFKVQLQVSHFLVWQYSRHTCIKK